MLKLPISQWPALECLLKFSEAQWGELASFLIQFGSADDLSLRCKISVDDSRRLLALLTGLSLNARLEHLSASKIVEDLATQSIERNIPKSQVDALKEHLGEVLSSESLLVAAKAMELTREHQRFLVRSKIISDVRFVFAGKDDLEPRAALVSHSLKLTFSESDSQVETFFALESSDLMELKAQIERALQKERALRSVVSDLPWVIEGTV